MTETMSSPTQQYATACEASLQGLNFPGGIDPERVFSASQRVLGQLFAKGDRQSDLQEQLTLAGISPDISPATNVTQPQLGAPVGERRQGPDIILS